MDIPVQFLIDNLKKLVMEHTDLIGGAESEMEQLINDLLMLKAIMINASRQYTTYQVVDEWEKQVRKTVYDVEDKIDACITQITQEKSKKRFMSRRIFAVRRRFLLHKAVGSGRNDITTLLKQKDRYFAMSDATLSDMADPTAAQTKSIREKVRQDIIFGFEDEAWTLISDLKEPSNKLGVFSITGMPGLGKTTLAWKIFEESEIQLEFPIRIWVTISDDLNMRNVLLTILRKFTSQVPAENTPIDELSIIVRKQLKETKYLIVMDDVWSPVAWDELKSFLPMDNARGRVLITTRFNKVAYHANNLNRPPHKLKFLTAKESWHLLQYEVYGEINAVPEELVEVGWVISYHCNGLPLLIVVIGGILREIVVSRGTVLSIKKQWEDVSTSVETNAFYRDKTKRLENIIRPSYVKLPYELRDCFLYLGIFPENAEISVKKLTLLLISEGFIQERVGKSLEETSYDNVKELIDRNLLVVEKATPNGEAKTCRVHDAIQQFCIMEAKNLNLLWTTHGAADFSLVNGGNCRRLCIHSNVRDFFSRKPKVPNTRSFLSFPKSSINLGAQEIAQVIEAFSLLRIFDADIKFLKFPPKVGMLIHLRYLTLTFNHDEMDFLLDVMSNLWNLQTLMMNVSAHTLYIRADISRMMNLRHLKTNASIVNDGIGPGGQNLQTLERLSPESCSVVFNKARNLVKLGIQGDLSSPSYSENLKKLELLNKLKLVHKVQNREESGMPVCCLPEPSKFPPGLKVLVLTGTHLNWQQMSVLGEIPCLEALKLRENAFTGKSWKAGTGGFQSLELLHIERSDMIFIKASGDSFPQLRFLVLKDCEKLVEVPIELSENLEMLSLERVTESAVSSAEEIKKKKGGNFVLKVASRHV